jgi:hypothetical protein
MKTFSEAFDEIFYKLSHSPTFDIPLSIKELKLFTEKVCLETYKELNNQKIFSSLTTSTDWSQSHSDLNKEAETKNSKKEKANDPIGMNSLTHTFNILQTVGQGKS